MFPSVPQALFAIAVVANLKAVRGPQACSPRFECGWVTADIFTNNHPYTKQHTWFFYFFLNVYIICFGHALVNDPLFFADFLFVRSVFSTNSQQTKNDQRPISVAMFILNMFTLPLALAQTTGHFPYSPMARLAQAVIFGCFLWQSDSVDCDSVPETCQKTEADEHCTICSQGDFLQIRRLRRFHGFVLFEWCSTGMMKQDGLIF